MEGGKPSYDGGSWVLTPVTLVGVCDHNLQKFSPDDIAQSVVGNQRPNEKGR